MFLTSSNDCASESCGALSPPHRQPANRGLTLRGLTLVEMLISMAVTLVMMAAVVNLFANIGSGVRTRRASMELGSQLRMARARLFKDLAGATCAARPKLPSDDHSDGYLEIIDGLWSDSQPSNLTDGIENASRNNFELDYTTSLVPSGGDPGIQQPASEARSRSPNDITNGGGLGDKDSVLALTVRSESEPFVGRYVNPTTDQVETIESDLAEVIWYLVENPHDGSLGEPGMRTLYRRVLLIAPWVELPSYFDLPGANLQEKILTYYRNYDISAQVYQVGPNGNLTADPDSDFPPGSKIPLVPNTLSDLTKREYRFAHSKRADDGSTIIPWPYHIDLNVAFVLPYDADTDPLFPDRVSPLRPFGRPFETTAATNILDRKGDDVMLNDVLAFDLRVYDPGAPLVSINNGPVLEPADAGWHPAAPGAIIVGFGSFVSLGWDPSFLIDTSFYQNPPPPRYVYNYANPPAGIPVPQFKEPHAPGWHPRNPTGPGYNFFATYDTWSNHYEDDGIDQDVATDRGAGVDQGTNGLDDIVPYDHDGDPTTSSILPTIGVNGVDDATERETSPPYDTPLRGVQAKIRVYDRDSRQIREATVTRNFVPQ